MFDFRNLKKAVSDIGGTARDLRRRRETLMREREDLLNLPAPREEFAEALVEWVELQREKFLQNLPQTLPGLWRQPGKSKDKGAEFGLLKTREGSQVQQWAILGLLAPLIADSVRQAALEMPGYPEEVGPPMATRAGRIEKIDAEIIEIERQYAELRDQAEAAGIRFDRLDSSPSSEKQISERRQ